jgi:hypothetical protein
MRSNNLKLLNKLNNNVNRVISIDTIYTTLIEYQVLKRVLLTNEEISCLKALKKPVYESTNSEHELSNLFDYEKLTEQDHNSIRDLENKLNRTPREEKLIQLYYTRI